jgi:cytochrome c biogenesis protein CcdA
VKGWSWCAGPIAASPLALHRGMRNMAAALATTLEAGPATLQLTVLAALGAGYNSAEAFHRAAGAASLRTIRFSLYV